MKPSHELHSAPGRPAAARSRRPPARGVFAGFRVGSIGGVEISLDYSWFIIFFLILGTFAGAVFPAHIPGLDRLAYLTMGLIGAALFFGSLLLHELAHAFMAIRKGIGVEGITLFIFGGMARTEREPDTPGDEFLIAGVGPLASFVLAALFHGAGVLGSAVGAPLAFTVVAEYLGVLNLVLAIFNLFPGFPLDGGRLLRATLWRVTGSLRRATEIASAAGRALGWGIIALGLYQLVARGMLVGGLWFIFIGWFLNHAARSSYQQMLLQEMLAPLMASQAMTPDPESVAPDLLLEELVHGYFLRRPYNSFPVTEDGVPIGLVTLAQVKALPTAEWGRMVVADVMTPLSDTLVVAPDTPMIEVLDGMRRSGTGRVLVASDWRLVGIISGADLTRWLDRVALLRATP
ncbi:MAG: site-2 protease family protein [Gemmatimonadota bacterium]